MVVKRGKSSFQTILHVFQKMSKLLEGRGNERRWSQYAMSFDEKSWEGVAKKKE